VLIVSTAISTDAMPVVAITQTSLSKPRIAARASPPPLPGETSSTTSWKQFWRTSSGARRGSPRQVTL